MNHLLIHACDGIEVVALLSVAFCGVVWLSGLRDRRPVAEPDEQLEYVSAVLRIPRVDIADGHRVQLCELMAVEHLIDHQVAHLAEALHDEAMSLVLAQVAAHEAKGLDTELEHLDITGGAR